MPARTFVVERNDPQTGAIEQIEVKAQRGDQDEGSSRVTFYDAHDKTVASFINVTGWYEKAAKGA